jgi:hypothetical protein
MRRVGVSRLALRAVNLPEETTALIRRILTEIDMELS